MLLFVGKKEKGFFTEETKEKVEYIDEHYISKTRQKQY